MDNTIISSDKVSHAAIVSFSDGEMRAAGPKGFKPNSRGKLFTDNIITIAEP